MSLEHFSAAQRAWPGVRLSPASFEAHLQRLGWGEALPPYFSELYLCCACLEHDAEAWRAFEAHYARAILEGTRQVSRNPLEVDEAAQDVRHKLALAPRPKLAAYTGKGPLAAWLRVVAVRTTLDRLRREQAQQRMVCALTDSLPELVSCLEGRLDRLRLSGAFARCFQDALHALSARERNVLRLHYFDGCNIDAIGRLHGVHRATVARWLAGARGRLKEAVQRALGASVALLTDSELEGAARSPLASASCLGRSED